MKRTNKMRSVFSLATGGWLLVGLFLLLSGTSQVAQADPGELFVSPDGTGAACSQATPCTLQTALDIAETNGEDDTIYLAAGTYQGNFVIYLEHQKSLTLRGEPGTTTQDVILDGGGAGRVLGLWGSMVGSLSINGLTIQNGQSHLHAGGINLDIHAESDVNVEIWNSIIRHNQAGKRGGGIKATSYGGNSTVDLLVVNTLIYGNQATWSGGGIDVAASEVGDNNVTRAVVINSTITDNVADAEDAGSEKGGGIRVHAYGGTGAIASLDLYNTIVYGNTLGGGDPQDLHLGETGRGNAAVNAYYSDIGDVTSHGEPTYSPVNVIHADPAFVDPANDDYHLTSSSPCIDAGTTAIPDPPGLPTTDFEGNPRVLGAAPDIGADEYGYVRRIYLPLVAKSHL